MNRGILTGIVVVVLLVASYGAVRMWSARRGVPAGPPAAGAKEGALPLLKGEFQPVEPRRPLEIPAPAPPAAAAETLDRADALCKSSEVKDLMEARRLLTDLLLRAPEGAGREAIRRRLDALNAKLFFSPLPTPDSVIHTVAPGEVLWQIKNKYRSSVELIKKVNHRTSDIIRAGETLKIPQGTFSVVADRAHFRLMVFLNGHYIKEYPIGIGKGSLTPAGEFTIQKMSVHPSWTDREGKVHKYGDPENPLGTRWIGFAPAQGRSGLGLHGTDDESSIGTKCSQGCIRLRNRDIEELYGMLNLGDKVTIR